ncbi:MAG: sulfurtransferase TusA family protein [bacterium]
MSITAKAPSMSPGDVLEVSADCHAFEDDVKNWCVRMKKTLLWVRSEGGDKKKAQIQF